MDLTKADAAIETALQALRASGARFRLRDILVEEVSLVDRAANKRRFLVVKSGSTMSKTDEPESVAKVDLPKPVKEGLLRMLTEALERLVSVANLVRDANETEEQMQQPVPKSVGAEITKVCELLQGALEKYPSPVAGRDATAKDGVIVETDGAQMANMLGSMLGDEMPEAARANLSALGSEAADKLKVLASVLAMIAEAESPEALAQMANRLLGVGKALKAEGTASRVLATVADAAQALSTDASKADALEADTVIKIRQLAASLNELVEKYPSPVAGAADGGDMDPTTKQDTPADPPAADDTDTKPAEGDAADNADGKATAAGETKNDGTPADGDATAAAAAPAEGDAPAKGDDDTPPDTDPAPDPSVLKMAEAVAEGIVSLTKRGAKMSSARLKRLRLAMSTLTELLDELDPVAAKDTAKRIAEMTPQAPPNDNGDLGNVGTGASDSDQRNDKAEQTPELQDVMKSLSELQATVAKLADAPEPPASRADEGNNQGAADGAPTNGQTKRQRRNRWVM